MARQVKSVTSEGSVKVVRAVVEKLVTADGLVHFQSGVKVGSEYLVRLDSIRKGQAIIHYHDGNGDEPITHTKDIIWTVEGFWLPLECLRLMP
jgi:hypothetical protein